MLTAVVTRGAHIEVAFLAGVDGEATDAGHESTVECEFPHENPTGTEQYPCDEGPSPILPEVKELAWGGGSFIVLAVLMRLVLYPRLRRGMDARYAHITTTNEQADAARLTARAEVESYETALAAVKAEAAERIESVRRTLEAERAERLAAVNATIAADRDAAAAEAQAERDAARGDIADAAADVAARTLELSTGITPDAAAVRTTVDSVMGAGVAR